MDLETFKQTLLSSDDFTMEERGLTFNLRLPIVQEMHRIYVKHIDEKSGGIPASAVGYFNLDVALNALRNWSNVTYEHINPLSGDGAWAPFDADLARFWMEHDALLCTAIANEVIVKHGERDATRSADLKNSDSASTTSEKKSKRKT